ncbi:MAG TPA: hypothetical protein VFY67_03410 [Pyrinomonadaceae bacterium]|nr:hypothetical protein [Pyrinomonadaceae bacterium]
MVIPLDPAPRTWTSMEEINRRLSQRLTSLGITVVLVYARDLPPARTEWASRYSIAPDELIMSSVTLFRPFKCPETLVEAARLVYWLLRETPVRLLMLSKDSLETSRCVKPCE